MGKPLLLKMAGIDSGLVASSRANFQTVGSIKISKTI